MEHNGGSIVAEVLKRQGTEFLFTLCGGHISPILVGAKERGIRVVGVRDEKNAVFAADAVARMSGRVGVAAVTAGPGVTNTLTAIKNAQMAESPLILFGGAAATVLKGRGSLQDIDHLSMLRSITKWSTSVKTVAALGPTVERAFEIAARGIPGPVFVEIPVDLLYQESLVRDWYLKESSGESLEAKALQLYLKGHLYRQFHLPHLGLDLPELRPSARLPADAMRDIKDVAELLRKAERPALVVGSQALANCSDPGPLAAAIESLGLPVWLGGTARGLLGRESSVQFRHKRSASLKKADLVIVCGFPFDFRLGYGRSISGRARVVAANLCSDALRMNRKPEIPVRMHPGRFLELLAEEAAPGHWDDWLAEVREREAVRDAEILAQAGPPEDPDLINPVDFFLRLEEKMSDNSVLAVDGGDFVATAAYILKPRRPLSWLDPGVFGTLGVGGGFAVGAQLVRPDAEVWLIYGDGSSAYSLAEFDTCVREGLAPIAVIGTDASWQQIARDQVTILGDACGTELLRTAYHTVAEGYGAKGLLLTKTSQIDAVIDEAKELSAAGTPVCINIHLGPSDFRKGSLSI